MKKLGFSLLLACAAMAQTALPPINTLTAAGITCTFTVIDAQMSVATECVDAGGVMLKRSIDVPTIKGDYIGKGPVQCLYSTDGAATPTVRLQCMTDDGTATGPKAALDGKLAPVTKQRQWWLLWR